MRLATSEDGVAWNWVSRQPVVSLGAPGTWNGGRVYAGCGLVPLGPDRIALPIAGFRRTHNDRWERREHAAGLGWAWWPRERLVALEAPGVGGFTTRPLIFDGTRLLLNFATLSAGEVRVKLAGANGEPLPGRSFAASDPLRGDDLAHAVTWQGDGNVGHRAGQPIFVRFRLRQARLFALRFADAVSPSAG